MITSRTRYVIYIFFIPITSDSCTVIIFFFSYFFIRWTIFRCRRYPLQKVFAPRVVYILKKNTYNNITHFIITYVAASFIMLQIRLFFFFLFLFTTVVERHVFPQCFNIFLYRTVMKQWTSKKTMNLHCFRKYTMNI